MTIIIVGKLSIIYCIYFLFFFTNQQLIISGGAAGTLAAAAGGSPGGTLGQARSTSNTEFGWKSGRKKLGKMVIVRDLYGIYVGFLGIYIIYIYIICIYIYIDGLKLRMLVWTPVPTRAKLKICVSPAFRNLECAPTPSMKLFGNQQLECSMDICFFQAEIHIYIYPRPSKSP